MGQDLEGIPRRAFKLERGRSRLANATNWSAGTDIDADGRAAADILNSVKFDGQASLHAHLAEQKEYPTYILLCGIDFLATAL